MPCCAVLTPSSCATRRDWLGASSLAATLMRHRVSQDSWHDNVVCCQLYSRSEVFHWHTVAKRSWAVPHMVSSSLLRDCQFVIARGSSFGTSSHNAVLGTSMGPYRCLLAVTARSFFCSSFAFVGPVSGTRISSRIFLFARGIPSVRQTVFSFRNVRDRCWRH